MQEITITLPIDTINAALNALAKLPYEFALPHIELIRQRGAAAMQEAHEAANQKPGGTD